MHSDQLSQDPLSELIRGSISLYLPFTQTQITFWKENYALNCFDPANANL